MSDDEPTDHSEQQSEEQPTDSDQPAEQSEEQPADSDQPAEQSDGQPAEETDQPEQQSDEQPAEQSEEQPTDSDQSEASASEDNTLAFAGGEESPGDGGGGGSATPILRKAPKDKAPGKAPAPQPTATATQTKAWSPNDSLAILFQAYRYACVGGIVWAGHPPDFLTTCEGPIIVCNGAPVRFHMRYVIDNIGGDTRPYPNPPLKGEFSVSALFDFTTGHGQHKEFLKAKDSAPRYLGQGDTLEANLGPGVVMEGSGLVIPITFTESGELRVLLQLQYVGSPGFSLTYDDTIDVQVTPPCPGTETGIYIHVPDPKNAPLVYKRITGHEGWQKQGSILTVWRDDHGYYYYGKEGKVYLPGKP